LILLLENFQKIKVMHISVEILMDTWQNKERKSYTKMEEQ